MTRRYRRKPRLDSISIAPTWAHVLPMLLALIEDSNAEGRRSARAELARMAQAADLFNARGGKA